MKTEIRRNKVYSLFMTTLAALAIAACSTSSEDPAITSGSDNVVSESAEDSFHGDVEDISSAASAESDVSLTGRVNSSGRFERWGDERICANTVISIKKAVQADLDTVTIDFGAGCTDPKGNIRKGKILIMYLPGDGRWKVGGSVTVTTDNFTVNGVLVEGTRTVENVSPNLEGDITWKITVTDGQLTFPNSTTATRETVHFRQWVRNNTPLNPLDDEMRILASYGDLSSTATGTNRKGYSYITTITQDITYKFSCLAEKIFVPVSGEKTMVVTKGTDIANITINYGDGTCDRSATITVNGKSATITVKRDDNG